MGLIINFQEEELGFWWCMGCNLQAQLKKRKQKGMVSLLEHASMQLVNHQDYRLYWKKKKVQ